MLDVLSPLVVPPPPSSLPLPPSSLPLPPPSLPPPPPVAPPAPSSSESKSVFKPYTVPQLPEELEEVADKAPVGRPTRERNPPAYLSDKYQFGGAPNEPPKEMYNFPLDSNQFWFMMEPSKTLYKDDLMLLRKIISADTITEEVVKANPTVFNSDGKVSKFGFYNPFIIMNNQIWVYLSGKGLTVYYDHVRNKLYDMGYCTVTAYYDAELYTKVDEIVKEIDADRMYGFGLLEPLPFQSSSSEQPEVVLSVQQQVIPSNLEKFDDNSSVEQRPATTTNPSNQPSYFDKIKFPGWLSGLPFQRLLSRGGSKSNNRKTMKKHKHKKTIKQNKKIKRFQTIKHKTK